MNLQSPCGQIAEGPFRYLLWREVAPLFNKGTVLFVMLNPSNADAQDDDPTMTRAISFAERLGYRRIEVVNLYAFRSPYPSDLARAVDPVGPQNDRHIDEAVARADCVIVAWGGFDKLPKRLNAQARAAEVLARIADPKCLGTTVDGNPRHPLMLAKTTPLTPYPPPGEPP